MAFIVETIAADRRIQLAGEEFVRPLRMGSAWTRLRVGLRLQFNGVVTANNAIFMIGVCQGTTNTFNNGNTTDYLGTQCGNADAPSWAYAITFSNHFACTQGGRIVGRQGSTNTNVNGASLSFANINNTTSGHSVCFFDITKGSPSYSVNCFFQPQNSGLGTDYAVYDILSMTEAEGGGTSILTTNDFPYSGNSLFDTLSIYWNRATPTLEICDICVVKLY